MLVERGVERYAKFEPSPLPYDTPKGFAYS